MGWVAFTLIGVSVLVLAWATWYRWIAPWRRIKELADSVASNDDPGTFILGGTPRARATGLVLEKLSQHQRELIEQVREGESRVQAILGAMPDGLVVVDEHHQIRMMNPAFGRLFEIEGEATGLTLLETMRDAAVDRAVTETLQSGATRRESIQVTQRSGGKIEIAVTAAPLRERSDPIQGAVVLFRDVTRLHRVEEMRRDFVANVSHELRTPLSIFRGYLETLLENPKQPPAELLRIFRVMEKHSNRLNLLVEDVLSLAELEDPSARLSLTEIYVPDFLTAILRDWEKRFDAKLLRYSLDSSPNLPILCADENRLQEIIYNLLDNAVKYSQPEGSIRVKAERVGNYIRLSIGDQGIGVPKRDLPRIFERFYRADKARSRELGGTGLGLSIVKHIAELHGGRVEAESEVGRGTTISVTLPIRPAEAAPVRSSRLVTES
jgi:two-component system, OmpR family, phosphate regulon sensor histidine kinase PhoR